MCGFFKMNCLGLLMFLPLIQSLLVFVARVVENYIPGSETLDLGAWCGAGAPHSQDMPPNFYPPHMSEGPDCSISAPLLPVLMDVVSLTP